MSFGLGTFHAVFFLALLVTLLIGPSGDWFAIAFFALAGSAVAALVGGAVGVLFAGVDVLTATLVAPSLHGRDG